MKLKTLIFGLVFLLGAPQSFGQSPEEIPKGLRDEKGGLISAKTNKHFADANPEDITNENFPDLIESFDYPNADIADVIKAISELTGKNFIVDPQVRGKITIIAPSQITVAEAYRAFLSALAINGLTVVPSGAFLKIKTARDAQRDSIETYSGEYFPDTDQMITRIVKLKYISAEEVRKQIRILPSKSGEVETYAPTNSLILSDFGSNIERIMKIVNQLDVPGFEEKLEVIRIRFAKAKDIEKLLSQIIDKEKDGGSQSGVPRFRRRTKDASGASGGAENLSIVVGDERTNSIIVVGNKAGISKIRRLVSKLDFRLSSDEEGGVHVYYVRHSEAETIADTLNGIASESNKAQDSGSNVKLRSSRRNNEVKVGPSSAAIFGGDVKVTADKNTNSLIITASSQDYQVVKGLLAKIDIPRDQVYVKVVIMEMSAQSNFNYGIDYYKFAPNANGIGRAGFRSGNLSGLLDPTQDSGGILGFGSGETLKITIPGASEVEVTSVAGLIKFLQANAQGNVLSTPQIMALDNEESEIEVGANVPVGSTQSSTAAGTTSSIEFKDATIKLVITPFISPDTDAVKLKLDQTVNELSDQQVQASELAESAVATNKRRIKTQIVVNSGDTAVLGGLMQDKIVEQVTKVPVLGDIPIIGWLFKGKKVEKQKQNLLVFLTPKVIRSEEDNNQLLTEKLNERIDFIQQNMKGEDPHGFFVDKLPRRSANAKPLAPSAKKNSDEDLDELPPEQAEEPAGESF